MEGAIGYTLHTKVQLSHSSVYSTITIASDEADEFDSDSKITVLAVKPRSKIVHEFRQSIRKR